MTTLHQHSHRQHDLGHAVEIAAAVDAARQLGILGRLAKAPAQADELTRQCRTAPETTSLLLDALDAAGVVARDGAGYYTISVEGRWCAALTSGWTHLTEVVRTGRPVIAANTTAGAGHLYPDLVPLLSRLAAPAAARAATLLAPGAGAVLDVGAGAAPWSIALAEAYPDCRVTALDLPDVLASTRRAASEVGCLDRFEFLAADMFTARLPIAGYDLILLGDICHLFDPDTAAGLLARLRPALKPGGTLAIIDALPSDDPDQRRQLSLYALSLRLRTTAGRVHPESSYRAWTRAADLEGLAVAPLSSWPPLYLMTALAGSPQRPTPGNQFEAG